MQRQKLLTLCDFLCYVFTFDLFISHANPRKATDSLYYSVLCFHFWFIYLTRQPKKSYWLFILLCVVFSLLIYLSHMPTQDMFKLLGKLMTSNLNDRQDYLMINYWLYARLILKVECIMFIFFILVLLWSLMVIFLLHLCIDQNYNDVALHLDITLSEPNASIMGFEWVLSTRSNEWGQIDIVEDDWEMYKSW